MPKRTPSPTAFVPVMDTSYFCLSADPQQNLCLGVSSGTAPANSSLPMQIKQRLANEATGLDFYKMRFDLNLTSGEMCMAATPSLCVSTAPRVATGVLGLGLSSQASSSFNLTSFFNTRGFTGALVDERTGFCVTAMKCDALPKPNAKTQTFCKQPGIQGAPVVPARSLGDITHGSFVMLTACDSVKLSAAQTWVQALDCAPGCSPFMQQQPSPCYAACKNAACDWQNLACATESPSASPSQSPTPPTQSPTRSPSSTPSETPSRAPSETPSGAPSSTPSRSPSETPSHAPSASPSSGKPSFAPTQTPSLAPTQTPSHAPSHSPSELPLAAPAVCGWWCILLIVLAAILLAFCCCGLWTAFFAVRERRKLQRLLREREEKEQKEKEKEKEKPPTVLVDAADAADVEAPATRSPSPPEEVLVDVSDVVDAEAPEVLEPPVSPRTPLIPWRDDFLRELRTVFTFGYTFGGVRAPMEWKTVHGKDYAPPENMTEEKKREEAMKQGTT
jgi:hypothetical protein